MMIKTRAYILLTFFSLSIAASGQFIVTQENDVEVISSTGQNYQNPWAGGLIAVHLSKFDADFDGEEDDLFIFDKAGNRVSVFIGSEENGESLYSYSPEISKDFPALRDFVLLRDFNCDGKRDIFTYSPLGGAMAVWRNTGSAAQGLSWNLESEALLSFYEFSSNSYTTNIYCSSQDVPAVFDYEGDGDLDIMSFNVGGTFIELHLNQSVENSGNCGFDYYLANRCYGGFIEGENSNDINLDPEDVSAECTFNVPDPKSGGGLRHVGSTILTLDGNNDGLQDLVLGDVGFTNLVYLENESQGEDPDQIVSFEADFPNSFGGSPVSINNFPAAFYEDIDNDGSHDLVVGVNAVSGVSNKASLQLYLNVGSETAPQFSLITDAFLQNEMLDWGESSKPVPYDYNFDGRMDLVVGTRGEFIGEGNYFSHLILIQNTGTIQNPSFQIVDDNWLDIPGLIGLQNPSPCFGDFDGDEDLDLVIGFSDGTLHYFENSGNLEYLGPLEISGSAIDLGNLASPASYDLNNDGNDDLIVGEADGNLNYFENAGNGIPQFNLVTENLGEISTTETPPFFFGNSSPHFYEFEGQDYLAIGSKSGQIYQFEVGGSSGDWTNVNGEGFGVYGAPQSSPVGLNTHPAIFDWNDDEIPDMVVGLVNGGLEYFTGSGFLSIANQNQQEITRSMLYPNPARDFVFFRNEHAGINVSTVEVYNANGVKVKELSGNLSSIDVSSLNQGLYIFLVRTNQDQFFQKIMIE